MKSINPNADKLGQVLAGIPQDKPIVMLNLLKFSDQASYPEDFSGDAAVTGREAYERYKKLIMPFISEVKGEMIWAGSAVGGVIIPDDESWDEVFLIRYNSINAFYEMLKNPGYQEITVHRTAALDDSRLVATVE
jgi:uncharacterized protein (DUF1330 family)